MDSACFWTFGKHALQSFRSRDVRDLVVECAVAACCTRVEAADGTCARLDPTVPTPHRARAPQATGAPWRVAHERRCS